MTSPSTLEKPVVREARAADTAAIAILLNELGYPVTDEVLSVRLQKMPSAHCTFIAELEGAVAGFVGCSALDIYESDTPVCWVMALSVSERFRRRGIGRALLSRVEQWCADAGLWDIRVHSVDKRRDDHTFHVACGLEHSGRRFKNSLRHR